MTFHLEYQNVEEQMQELLQNRNNQNILQMHSKKKTAQELLDEVEL